MSCRNFEILKLHLDADERLVDYSFEKSQCRSVVGEVSLLSPYFKGLKAAKLMVLESEIFCRYYPAADSWEQYIYLKHFIAIKSALQVFSGHISGGANDFCTIASIGFDREGTIIEAQLEIGPLAASTRSCVRCKECHNKHSAGSGRKRRKIPAPGKKAG